MEGHNKVTVTATNKMGSDSKTAEINYVVSAKKLPPIVEFNNPASNPAKSTLSTYHVEATVLNVEGKSDITVKLNGFETTLFSYNSASNVIKLNVMLIEGANLIEVEGVNEVGDDKKNTTIFYHKKEVVQLPIVAFLNPAVDPIKVYKNNYSIEAKVQFVAGSGYIDLKVNGIISTLFSYSKSSKLMTFNVNLIEGANVIEIKGTNKFGSDVETTIIVYKKEVLKAPPVVTITRPTVDNKVFASANKRAVIYPN